MNQSINAGWNNASNSNWKINSRMKLLYLKNWFLDVPLHRILCNALIQPHSDYACTAWYPNLTKKLKDKLQVTQNKCIRFSMKLRSREHISNENFHKLNWLPINQRSQQCITSNVFAFVLNKCPVYINEVFRPNKNMSINKRNSFLKLNHPFWKPKNQYRTKGFILYQTCYLEQNYIIF